MLEYLTFYLNVYFGTATIVCVCVSESCVSIKFYNLLHETRFNAIWFVLKINIVEIQCSFKCSIVRFHGFDFVNFPPFNG